MWYTNQKRDLSGMDKFSKVSIRFRAAVMLRASCDLSILWLLSHSPKRSPRSSTTPAKYDSYRENLRANSASPLGSTLSWSSARLTSSPPMNAISCPNSLSLDSPASPSNICRCTAADRPLSPDASIFNCWRLSIAASFPPSMPSPSPLAGMGKLARGGASTTGYTAYSRSKEVPLRSIAAFLAASYRRACSSSMKSRCRSRSEQKRGAW
mmetsp:Transcript_33435/g.92408  ORF Transcript_33435/g.92408 Transcript_33435/m.92408 type:complete len:210 (-) Transcript_33435:590-1219(-)